MARLSKLLSLRYERDVWRRKMQLLLVALALVTALGLAGAFVYFNDPSLGAFGQGLRKP